jgi:hypothetical protein
MLSSATIRKEANVCCQINMNYINEAVVVVVACELLANDLKSNLEKREGGERGSVNG